MRAIRDRLQTLISKPGVGRVLILLTLLFSLTFGIYYVAKVIPNQKYKAGKAVKDQDGQWVLVDELVILGEGLQNIPQLVKEFGGEVTVAVTETATYQVKFPVSNLSELGLIEKKLKEKGVRTFKVIVIVAPLKY